MDAGRGAFGRPGVRGSPAAVRGGGVRGADRGDGQVAAEPPGERGPEPGARLLHRQRKGPLCGAHDDLVQRNVFTATVPKTRANTRSPAQPVHTSEESPRPASAWDTASLR